jgi:hypothetical protein
VLWPQPQPLYVRATRKHTKALTAVSALQAFVAKSEGLRCVGASAVLPGTPRTCGGYNDLGLIDTVTYPCRVSSTGCLAGDPGRSIQHGYANGQLKSVGTWASNMTYRPNGTIDTITHGSGSSALEKWEADPHGMARPRRIYSTNAAGTQELRSSGNYEFDGSGNVKTVGNTRYAYDPFGRLMSWTATGASGSYSTTARGYDDFGNYLYTMESGCGPAPQSICYSTSFLPRDIQGTTNSYVLNNPMKYTDPNGREENLVGGGTIVNSSSQTVYIAFDGQMGTRSTDYVIALKAGESSEQFTFDGDAVVVAPGQNISAATSGSFKVSAGSVEIKDGKNGSLVLTGSPTYFAMKNRFNPEARSGHQGAAQTPQQWRLTPEKKAEADKQRQQASSTLETRREQKKTERWDKIKDKLIFWR